MTSIPTRRVSFDEALAHTPRHFAADDDLIMSHLTASLSAAFPDGEDYFVRTVRHYRKQITDPELKEQVKGFIGQESIHGREHRAFNAHLAELGYPTRRVERIVKRALAFRERVLSPETNLATTAALEHFTATLAALLLGNDEFRALTRPGPVLDLFLWHALEEAEHKAVAFDVYRATGGRDRTRITTMKIIRVGFVIVLTLQVAASLLGDRATYQRGRLRSSWKRFRRSAFLGTELREALRDYDRVDFHPNQHPTDELVDEWRNRLFGAEGTLNDKLLTPPTLAA